MGNKNNKPRSFHEWFFGCNEEKLSGLRDIHWRIEPIKGTLGYRVTGYPKELHLNGEYYPWINGEYKRCEIQKLATASKGGNNSRGNKSRGNNSKGNKSRENGRGL